MAERSDYQAGARSIPVIPYDTFEAANLFLATGRSPREVLARIGLEAAEWERLRKAYRWFPYALGEDDRRAYFDGLDDAAISDVLHGTAFFNWANRLMLSLGEPRTTA